MFTGLVEEVGSIRSMHRTGNAMKVTVTCHQILKGLKKGDSIAVNGVCLTVTSFGSDFFTADIMPETVKKTNFKSLSPRSLVNLERALAVGERMGGHFVQGHVDGEGKILSRIPYDNAVLFTIQVPEELTDWMVDQGSVAVNGISLTIVKVESESFSVSIIPHTLEATQLKEARTGDSVNIECDLVGKYVAKLAHGYSSVGVTENVLRKHGFS
ncbi:riboflavin synthase [Melghirimyces algeriensis]|uniref:Riboflavin synthase n=1 Tax=Melghirimyces algeriensis TaxID=910412 RepID=A0A521B2C1_9BACL|nr:riboflavin synthase [Melghirimyces algeriensis]SMO41196.1 riboflavin synthase alpha chain [Melghirimyces algeriensis]